MNQKQLMAIVVVIIVVIAAVSVAAYAMIGDDDDDEVPALGSSLEVYGNANGDYVIDETDRSLAESIIRDNLEWEETYPFADANYDGVVDEADLEQIDAIINASATNRVVIYHNAQDPDGRYVVDTTYPILSASMSTAQTTTILLKTIGIVNEIVGINYSDTTPTTSDAYVYADYFDIMVEERRVGSGSGVNVDAASNLVTEYGMSAYIYSSSSSRISNEAQLEGAGIDCIQVADGVADPDDFNCAVLLLGFLFDNGSNGYMDVAIRYVEWVNEFWADMQQHLEPVTSGAMEKKSGVASSMSTYISVKTSTNTDVIVQAGMYCPVADRNSSTGGTTIVYNGDTDTWLNNIDLDYVVILKGSSEGWSWFDKDYSPESLPHTANSSSYSYHVNNFRTLECFMEGNVFIVSTMMPAPLKSAVIAEHIYPELFDEGWASEYLYEFFQTFWGFSKSDCDGLKFLLTQDEVLG